jgi:two-component system CheB/CheR fusion protein
VADVQAVLDTLVPRELEVKNNSGEWFLLRIRPYRTLENVIEGAVITFIDFTEKKQAREHGQRLAIVIQDAHDAILLQDLLGRILAWNPAAQRIYGWSEAEALGMNIRDLIPEGLHQEELARIQQLIHSEILEPYCGERVAKDGTIVKVWLTATSLVNKDGQVYAVASTERAMALPEKPAEPSSSFLDS